MSKLSYAVVFSSRTYQELIYKTLEKKDIMFVEPESDDEKCLSEYVKRETSGLSTYDAFIIDLGVLKDTDEQIIEALQSIRFFDDKVRIIILEGTRENSEKLLQQCFLNGIYNIVAYDDFVTTKMILEKCVTDEGMSYKDGLVYKDAEARKAKKEESTVKEFHRQTIAFLGSQCRIGTTHCVLTTAYTLRKCGYLVAVIDYTDGRDYLELMKSYEAVLNDKQGFSVDEIDFYINPESEEVIDNQGIAYNFVIYDFGCSVREAERSIFESAAEKILIVGSKPWELPRLSEVLKNISPSEKKILFNLTSQELEQDLRKMLKEAGIANEVYFMEYQSNFFSESSTVKNMLQVVPQKTKRRWFRKNHA